MSARAPQEQDALDGLDPRTWARANRELIAKLLTELAFEELIRPEPVGSGEDGRFRLALGALELRYSGRLRALGYWRVDPGSLEASMHGRPVPLPDASEVVALGAPLLGADPSTAAGLVGEVAATALSDARQIADGAPVEDLVEMDGALLEGQMRGHPWIVAAKGRVGFGLHDLAAYAPESGRPHGIGWLAVDPSLADVRTVEGLEIQEVLDEHLGEDRSEDLRRRAAESGLGADAVLVPVHPWQWSSRIATLHAGDLARGRMAWLGDVGTRYLPQQSIRTLADPEHPERRHLKLALSILNTSVYRGLPRARALAAPALTDWLTGLASADPFLAETGLVMLGEVASVSVAHRGLESIPDVPYQHTEMLGAIWRESVEGRLEPGERAITMAALIHRDPRGAGFVEPLVERSGLAVGEWVRALHEVTLPPLVHVLYRYGVTFSPHAQNCLVGLREGIPTRLVVKDFVDDAMVSSDPLPELADLPAEVRAALGPGVESAILPQWIQAGLLVCVHRYLAEVLADRLGYPEREFWAHARGALARYQERMGPSLGSRLDLFDLDAPAFVRLCLNRVRILGRGYADDPERPIASASGWIDNPLAGAPVEPQGVRA